MAVLPTVVQRHTCKELRQEIREKIIATWFDYYPAFAWGREEVRGKLQDGWPKIECGTYRIRGSNVSHLRARSYAFLWWYLFEFDRAVQWLKRLVAGPEPWVRKFNPRPQHVWYVLDGVTLGQGSPPPSPDSIILPVFHADFFVWHRRYAVLATDFVIQYHFWIGQCGVHGS